MILVKLFKLGIAFLVLAAALTTTTMAQEIEQEQAEPVEATERVREEESPEVRNSRLNDYKERANERATEAKLNRVRSRCVAAQTRLGNIINADKSRIDTRIAAHQRVINAVDRTTRALEEAGVDTSELNGLNTQLQQKSDEVVKGLEAYVTTLNDIIAVDCEADTEAFQAGLSIAREARSELKELAASFREFVKSDVKQALQQVKNELTTE